MWLWNLFLPGNHVKSALFLLLIIILKAHVLSNENEQNPAKPEKGGQTTYTENETLINPLEENGNSIETLTENEDPRSDQEKNPKLSAFRITFGLFSLFAAVEALFIRKKMK